MKAIAPFAGICSSSRAWSGLRAEPPKTSDSPWTTGIVALSFGARASWRRTSTALLAGAGSASSLPPRRYAIFPPKSAARVASVGLAYIA